MCVKQVETHVQCRNKAHRQVCNLFLGLPVFSSRLRVCCTYLAVVDFDFSGHSDLYRAEQRAVAITMDATPRPIPADTEQNTDGISKAMGDYKLAEHEKNRAWKILATGSVAGTLSGLMGTLAGQPGPPLILMFALLKVPKVLSLHFVITLRCVHTGLSIAATSVQSFPDVTFVSSATSKVLFLAKWKQVSCIR